MYINVHVYEHRYSCFGQYNFFIKSALQRKQVFKQSKQFIWNLKFHAGMQQSSAKWLKR